MDKNKPTQSKKQTIPTASATLDDGTLVELVYQPARRKTLLALFSAGRWTLQESIKAGADRVLVPFSPTNNLIANEAVLLASEPCIYETEEALLADIERFIHRYVDLSPTFEKIASHYVLLTWVHDAFSELPYLRLRGDFGSGKTRALLTIGSLCYKAFFASGASTVSPVFHTLDAFRGTLILDEADFRMSDERADIVKILNNGNVRGMPILRTMMNRQREFNPQAFQVFGPKIVATRSSYDDKGLESRFVTEEMGGRPLRADIPINLPDAFRAKAQELRNKLLLYRFHHRQDVKLDDSLIDPSLEPRLNQILLPLLSIVRSPLVRRELRTAAAEAQTNLIAERGLLAEAQVLEILANLMATSDRPVIPIADVAAGLNSRYGDEYERPITNRWVGSVLRRRLNLRTYKSHGVYVVPMTLRDKVELLCTRYGVIVTSEVPGTLESGDVGTSGT